jgi:hypothetical protein
MPLVNSKENQKRVSRLQMRTFILLMERINLSISYQAKPDF